MTKLELVTEDEYNKDNGGILLAPLRLQSILSQSTCCCVNWPPSTVDSTLAQ